MDQRFYITTTLPYANDLPHIGHTVEFIQADVIARYFRQKLGKSNVTFNVGTDEHGLKLFKKAQEKEKDTKEYVDENVQGWIDFCSKFEISYDTFYRTSESYHVAPVHKIWREVQKKGYIYKKKYRGLYCVGCEEFKTEKELENGKCPLHGVEPVNHEEENYFFKLSAFKKTLLDWLESNPRVLKPAKRQEELKNWIKDMQDISISREKKNLPWGITVPDDKNQVVYVWFDALTNYIASVGYGREDISEDPLEWWPGVQCFGPDNLRFQGAIWQGMLAAIGYPQSKNLLCHGMILAQDGTKMSKTKGNVVSPFEQLSKFPLDAIRYYLIAGVSTFSDSPYSQEDLVNLYNSHLADVFGNLLNRVLHLAVSKNYEINDIQKVENEFKNNVDKKFEAAINYFDLYELQNAILTGHELATYGNEYITSNAPWSKDSSLKNSEKVLNNLSYLLNKVIEIYKFVLPETCKKASQMLINKKTGILFQKVDAK